MKEYKIDEEIILEVKENTFNNPKHPCKGCFFFDTPVRGACFLMCESGNRSDGKNVIFVEKGK